MAKANAYDQIISKVFNDHYRRGVDRVDFSREELAEAARAFGIPVPKNLGDIVYTYRYRRELPPSLKSQAPAGKQWVIMPAGIAKYSFWATSFTTIEPNPRLTETKVPDATPGLIARFALSDEQALLARVRYNRLVDIFTGVACYSLQNHLRTTVAGLGQIETDEIYVGVDRFGAQYVFPVQAKGGNDKLSVVQIAQDFEMISSKFPLLTPRPLAAQFLGADLIVLFELERPGVEVRVRREEHYRLVAPKEITDADLAMYRSRVPP
jgi:hypothetical protein